MERVVFFVQHPHKISDFSTINQTISVIVNELKNAACHNFNLMNVRALFDHLKVSPYLLRCVLDMFLYMDWLSIIITFNNLMRFSDEKWLLVNFKNNCILIFDERSTDCDVVYSGFSALTSNSILLLLEASELNFLLFVC